MRPCQEKGGREEEEGDLYRNFSKEEKKKLTNKWKIFNIIERHVKVIMKYHLQTI